METILAMIGLILTALGLILNIYSIKNPPRKTIIHAKNIYPSSQTIINTTAIYNQIAPEANQSRQSNEPDLPSIIIILILLSVLYAQFSTQIAIIVLSLGIVSTIIIFLFCKFDTIHNFSQKEKLL